MNTVLNRFFAPCALAVLTVLTGCQQITSSRVAVDYYAISGNSTASLDREIRRKGPKVGGGRHAVAVARIRMVPNLRYTPTPTGCVISRAKVNVDARVTLPRWTGRKTANKKLGKAWDNIDRYTRTHEAVHVAIAFRYAKAMESDLTGLRSASGCQSLRTAASAIVNKYLAQHDKSQRQFDADEQRRLVRLSRASSRKKS